MEDIAPARPRRPGITVGSSFGPPPDSPEFARGGLPPLPEWDRVNVPTIRPSFLQFVSDCKIEVVSVSRLPDAGHAVIWRGVLDEPGRYMLTTFWPDGDGKWLPTRPRPRMDIVAAYRAVAELTVRKAAHHR